MLAQLYTFFIFLKREIYKNKETENGYTKLRVQLELNKKLQI